MKNEIVKIVFGLIILSAISSPLYAAPKPKTQIVKPFQICGDKIPNKISSDEELSPEQCIDAINLGKNSNNIKTIYFGTNDNRDYCGSLGCVGFMWAQRSDNSLNPIGLGYNLYEVKYSGMKNAMPFFTIAYREANGINAVYKKIYFNPKTKTYK